MNVLNLITIYVSDVGKSIEFYKKIFEIEPSFIVPTYASFSMENGLSFSLWSNKAKDFISEGVGSRFELSIMVSDEIRVLDLYEKWQELGVVIEQKFHKAVFGPTFVVLDLDGHRIRVCIPD
ncbi:glyoxalase-like domain protein [Bacteriovorax sp. BSW11_IV]|uniref:VOC family protein n=1 Tax=Bacteriovorax sp. BSW11_IV TaxID=1353529 RepID=UPI00038A3CE1|nr:VOC family protein [Bacteriovorax sp. BSW11_IV]EQC48719.1 glyoxalase-like domain protein [Bacteriovorax sp. BSW11_IV]